MNEEMKEIMDKLKDSKIVEVEYYQIVLSNLCESITLISDDAGEDIERINSLIKSGDLSLLLHIIEKIQKRFWLISSLSERIVEKLFDDDFVKLDNLFYCYKQKNENKVAVIEA